MAKGTLLSHRVLEMEVNFSPGPSEGRTCLHWAPGSLWTVIGHHASAHKVPTPASDRRSVCGVRLPLCEAIRKGKEPPWGEMRSPASWEH